MRKDPKGAAVVTTLIFAGLFGFATSFASSIISDLVFEHKVDWCDAAISGGFGAIGGILMAACPSAACGMNNMKKQKNTPSKILYILSK